ncbi:cation-translocating P-type ATPase [Lactococcus ileimucosae]|uniref:cation-translocating P-type ATPase n=1 Tax=Lactococcus ileimucosae TaxID=2941329 RepID=UPI00204376BA|nr:cation-translocating P-type ATPase [Lactococcus ileimucosae]
MDYKKSNINTIKEYYKTNVSEGLDKEQITAYREKYGSNVFQEAKQKSTFQKLLKHVFEVMNLVLIIVSVPAFYLSLETDNFTKPIVILLIVIINVIVAHLQEERAETALSALKKLSAPNSTVIRNGKLSTIPSEELVVGDLIQLNAGEQVGADVRLLSANSLQVDESSLTGESEAIEKDASREISENVPLGDQVNMVFSGTNVLNGTAKGIVVATGMKSQMGQIAQLLEDQVKGKTPLQKRIDSLPKRLAAIAFGAGAVIFLVNLLHGGIPFSENMMTAVILGIAAVPETLPVIVTLSLVYGVENMAYKKAIIRNIPAVETLGNASVIASDKTGTLTQNQMTIQRLWVQGEDIWQKDQLSDKEKDLIYKFGLVSNATAVQEGGKWETHGDPTETAIINFLITHNFYQPDKEPERLLELPFDSTRKKMTVVVPNETGRYLVITKGAFDRLVPEHFKEAHEIHDTFAENALRVLALSYKVIDEIPNDHQFLEEDQTFLGIIGMIDPPRPESKLAVAEARNAGIIPVMITGDHALTAKAIAQELDIYREGDLVVDGITLSNMSDDELKENIEKISVYARVSPEDKLRIVKAWQDKKHIVAMTGDGVNDAPSLRAADVGTAMGISGTEVAKNASDIILADDNFATIVSAIAEGRRVYINIKRTIYYLLSANIAEILIMLIGAIIGWGLPLTGMQLLYINVLADGIPGFGLSRETSDKYIMKKPPIDVNESLFSRGVSQRIFTSSTTFIIISLIGFYIGYFVEIPGSTPSLQLGQSMTFLVLALASTYHIFNARSNDSIFQDGLYSNKTIFWTTVISLGTTFLFTLTPLRTFIDVIPLTATHWLIALLLSLLIFVVIEIEKYLIKKAKKTFLA